MIEACSSNPTHPRGTSATRNNNSMFNDPFFASDGFGTNSMDDLDGTDIFGILGDERGGLNDGGYGNMDDDLHLSTDQPFLSTHSSDSSQYPSNNNNDDPSFLSPAISTSSDGQHSNGQTLTSPDGTAPSGDYPPPPSPVVIDPTDIDKISIQLEKNQQCRCKSCNKLFNYVWYLKQHAVKHSNDRPFQCKFCRKTYKFRSNLYQHKCPERNRQLGQPNGIRKRFYTRGIAYTEGKGDPNNPQPHPQQQSQQQQQSRPLSVLTTPTPTTTTEPIDNSLSAPYEPQGGFQNSIIDSHSDIQFNLIPVEVPPMQYPPPESAPPMMVEKKPTRPENSIRERQLDPAYIEDYLARKRHKLFTCRKCKFQFPSRGHLSAHMTAHSLQEAYCYMCPQCPQKFCEERRLRNHLELHASDPNSACHRCRQCDGAFRSALALRRHIDQSRACYSHPFGIKPQMMIAPTQPIDPYAFIESDEENENKQVEEVQTISVAAAGIKRQKSIGDSGVGSDVGSTTTSPPRNTSSTLEEEYEEKTTPEDSSFLQAKRSKKSSENEDADSGFRSRLNSNLSCSPSSHSAISSGSDSPGRKYSTSHDFGNSGAGNYEALAGPSGSGSNYNNGCYSQNSSSRMNHLTTPAVHYSYGLIKTEDNFEMDSEDFGGQLLQKSVSTRNFRLIHNFKSISIENSSFIDRISDIPSNSFETFSTTSTSNSSSNGFPSETFETITPVNETSKELKAILAIFLNALIQTATKTARHQKE
jgi:hypothetical protein